uniref:DMT family transporter n=1 Tax=Thaumasiovibrio occultus TaxID=1891184 RepID=UPI000B34EA88|nr:DMT family transporter [Thaumasiovibrio occultus]
MYHFVALFTILLWSGNTIVNKLSAGVIEPGAMSFFRWFVAMSVLTPFCLRGVWRKRALIKPHLAKIAFLALLGMVLNQTFGYYAAITTTATNMALIMALVPLLSLFLSAMLLGKAVTPQSVVGAAISFFGLGYMLSQGDFAQLLARGVVAGDGLMLGAAITYALYCVLLKRWAMPFLSSWQMVYVQSIFAVLMLTPLWLSSESQGIPTPAVPMVLYAGLAVSVLAPFCWIRAIDSLGADSTAMYFNFLPVFSALLATVVLAESLTVYHMIGMVLVISGVTLAQLKKRRKPLPLLDEDSSTPTAS